MLSGCLGNMIDRLLYQGTVRDVFYFTWGSGVFNLADVYITISAISVIFFTLKINLLFRKFVKIIKKKGQKREKGIGNKKQKYF